MELHDVPAVTRLLRDYLSQFLVAPDFDEDDVEHWLLPTENVVDSYLVESPETHEITDFLQLLHSSFNYPWKPELLAFEGCLFLLQCLYKDSITSVDE
ncbi:hypothetical protein HHK36_032048 [Tetracentron sinense]|uniref:Glycylpeptide N-tetradecanoyltransferase n=1 Tax=Tetracentron sinense TaxID=13715 RepID=A0A834YA49_TETSI|nr:hypothetical protein HHK36_032048 [Tetracentron sinense]